MHLRRFQCKIKPVAHKWWGRQSRNIIIQSPGVAQPETVSQWGHQTSRWPGPPFINRPGLTARLDNHQPPRPIWSPMTHPPLGSSDHYCVRCVVNLKQELPKQTRTRLLWNFKESRHPCISPWPSKPRLALRNCSNEHWRAMDQMADSIPQLSTETYSL